MALRNVNPVRFDCMESVLKIEPKRHGDTADFSWKPTAVRGIETSEYVTNLCKIIIRCLRLAER